MARGYVFLEAFGKRFAGHMDRCAFFLWLQTRSDKIGPYPESLGVIRGSEIAMFNTFVRASLVRSGAVRLSEDLQMDHPSSAWSADLSTVYSQKILGGMLLRFS